MVGFVKLYFPVFLLGAVFGKLIELSGFSRSIVAAAIRILGRRHAIPVIVLVCALLTYGGCRCCLWWPLPSTLSPPNYFARADPQTADPATVALGAFSFTMDALPGTPQIQNIIPTSFFGTNAQAAPAGAYRLAVHYHLRFAVAGASAPQSVGPRRRLWDRPAK